MNDEQRGYKLYPTQAFRFHRNPTTKVQEDNSDSSNGYWEEIDPQTRKEIRKILELNHRRTAADEVKHLKEVLQKLESEGKGDTKPAQALRLWLAQGD